jgi:chemotaxis protein CheD
LKSHRIAVVSEDTGGNMGRKVVYHTQRNEAVVYKVNNLRQGDWYPYINEGR